MELTWLIWMFPFLFALHDGEEILTWTWWMERKGSHMLSVGRWSGPKSMVSRTTRQMTVAVLVVGAFVLAATIEGLRAVGNGAQPLLFTGVTGVWLIHSLGHVGASIHHRMYTPGVVTAVLICFPHGLLTFRALFETGAVTWNQVLVSGATGVAVAPLVLFLAHGAGRLLAPTPRGTRTDT